VIVKSYELNKFNFNKFEIFLFYGKNEGFQNEVIKKKFTNIANGSINKYEEEEFINNYDSILNGILTKGLFENEKIIIISRISDKVTKFIEELLEINLDGIKIILKTGVLEKKSKIRNFFEKNKKLVTIPFYEDDSKSLTLIILEFINKHKIKLSRESINLLVSRAGGNRENLQNELEKILNFSYSNNSIDYEIVKKLTNLVENYGVNELADNYLSKNRKNISKILNENNYSDDDCILILRTILSKSKRLIDIIERYQTNNNIEKVISETKPPIFWKDKEIVKKQANTWKLGDLKNKIYQINDIETLVKSNTKNSLNLVSDFINNY
tara:strand:- start:94 stop:1071 length:978 start_codon:yes stop_codon:yes gene_type:complete